MSGKGKGVTGGLTAICVTASVVFGVAFAWGAGSSPAADEVRAISRDGGAAAPMAESGATSKDERPPQAM